MRDKVTWEATKFPRWSMRELLALYSIVNNDWELGSIPDYSGNPYGDNHLITTNMEVKLDPWNREFIPYPIGDPYNYLMEWTKDSLLTFDWRYTSVEGKVIALHRIY